MSVHSHHFLEDAAELVDVGVADGRTGSVVCSEDVDDVSELILVGKGCTV